MLLGKEKFTVGRRGTAEISMRAIAVGRKNYLFAGSHNGAQRAAMMYSFFATCKKNNVDPYKWLHKVLEIIPTYKVNKLAELLPANLKGTSKN
ncbi:MAG: transposase domain-containing protein [Mangrovibacterium sp.]